MSVLLAGGEVFILAVNHDTGRAESTFFKNG